MSTSDLSNFLCKQSLFHLNDGHLLIQPHGNKNGLSNHFFVVLAWINVLHMAWLSDKQNAWHIHAHMEQLKNKTCIRICWYFISEVQQSKEVATYCCKQVKMLRNYTCTMRFIVSDMKWICKAISPDSYVVQHIGKEKKQLEEEKNAKICCFGWSQTQDKKNTWWHPLKISHFWKCHGDGKKCQQFVPTIYIRLSRPVPRD